MKKVLLLAPVLLSLCSCGGVREATLYSWHNYENAVYSNSKEKTEKTLLALMKTYKKMEYQQTGIRQTTPPGFHAELGYQYFKEGKKTEALKYLKKEIELYPESSILIHRIIQQIENK